MIRILAIPVLAFWFAQLSSSPQNFAGTYTFQDTQGPTTMVLLQDSRGKVTGVITMDDGTRVTLDGEIKGNEAIGIATMGEKNILFKLNFQGAQLIFVMIPVTEDAKPDMARVQEFTFSRKGGSVGGSRPGGLAGISSDGQDGNPLTGGGGRASRDALAGEFSDGDLHLRLEGNGGRYQGEIQFQGQTFPATAQSADGRTLKGKFTSGGNSFDFTGTLKGSTLTFSTGGKTYQLESQGGGPAPAANPLGGSSGGLASVTRGSSASQPIRGGETVNEPSMGVRFSVPRGWKYEKRQTTYVIGHDTIPGMILVMPHTSNTIQELQAAASEPLYQADDGQLMVTGSPETLASNMIAAEYGGTVGGKNAKGRIVGVVSPFGGGFLVMAGSDVAGYGPQHAQLAESIARSMQFSKPQAPPEAAMWKQKFSGMRVAYFVSGGSSDIGGAYAWSDKRDLYLCSNGSFQAAGGFSGSIGTANASGFAKNDSGQQSGQWAIVGQAGQPALQLRHDTGGVETFILSTDGSKTFLDGRRWYVVENPVCQ